MARPSNCWPKPPRSSRRLACRRTCLRHPLWLAHRLAQSRRGRARHRHKCYVSSLGFQSTRQGVGAKFDQATRPFQFAFQVRAGTDALAAHVRAALATRQGAVLVVSLDGRSAYDSMSRVAFLSKLSEVAPGALPRTAGGTARAAVGTSPRAKAASKGTLSLPRFSVWDSTTPYNRRRKRSLPATAWLLSWMTSTWSRCRPVLLVEPFATSRCAH